MTITAHPHPYLGDTDDIVAQHERLTGQTRLASRWWRPLRPVVEFEVETVLTVDRAGRFDMDLHEYRQSTRWVRS